MSAAAPRSVLVVDDDSDIRSIAALSLGRLGGFRVELADSGAQAVQAVAARRPDVVLLDVSMPAMDGPETLIALRAIPGAETLPVIFFTAASSEGQVQRLRELGAAGVVEKPFDVALLAEQIGRILAGEAVK